MICIVAAIFIAVERIPTPEAVLKAYQLHTAVLGWELERIESALKKTKEDSIV
jgi:hypothetical protein